MKNKDKLTTPIEIESEVRKEIRNFLDNVDWEKYNPNGVYIMVALLKEIFYSIRHCFSYSSNYAKQETNEALYGFVLTTLVDFIEETKAIKKEENDKGTKH